MVVHHILKRFSKAAVPEPPPPSLMQLSSEEGLAAGAVMSVAVCCLAGAFFLNPGTLRENDPRKISTVAWWRLVSAAAFFVNVAIVSISGRFDGDETAVATMSFPWDTLFSPARWAFAIWGVIYVGELLGILLPVFRDEKGTHAERAEAPPAPAWVLANISQCLWCATFRPWCLGLLWLPALMLGVTAVCLGVSQVSCHVCTPPLLVSGPRSLHLGWVTAACLVNVNAFVGSSGAGEVSPETALWAAQLSVVAAVLLGSAYALVLGLPAAALAVAWALWAVSKGEPIGAAANSLGPATLGSLSSNEAIGAVVVLIAALLALAEEYKSPTSPPELEASPELPSAAETHSDSVRRRRSTILGLGCDEEEKIGVLAAKCDVVIVGCGVPGKSMGWYHALNLLQGDVPSAELTDVVEPFFLSSSGAQESEGGKAFAAFAAEHSTKSGVQFHASVSAMPRVSPGTPKVAIIAGRTSDSPKLFREVIDKGCTSVYLEKPGAPSVKELEGMAALAKAKGVSVFMGYNKNVTGYVSEALEAERRLAGAAGGGGGATTTTFWHYNSYKASELPECFERCAEGLLKNMAVHELCLLVSFFGVTAANLASVDPDRAFSSCQTLTGPSTGAELTDFDKVGFTVTTREGRKASVYADRCGGNFSEAVVSDQSGKEVFRARTPNAALEARVKAQQAQHPSWMPYFLVQHDDYVALKERVCWAALDSTGARVPKGVASIDVAIETLKLAEVLTPQLTKELLKK